MKKHFLALLVFASTAAFAAPKATFSGSDTLAGPISDAIIQAGFQDQLQYSGGGSGLGEKGLLTGDQGIAPMSREIKKEAVDQLKAQGNTVKAHVIGLDGLSIFVKSDNRIASLDLPTIVKIYTCEFTKWEQIPNSGTRGNIKVYRRNDNSGTTDAFKHFTGVKTFGPCVTALPETPDIADATARDGLALGYTGLSGHVAGNRPVAIAAKPGSPAVLPNTTTIRNFSYPMSRKLFVYEITGARNASAAEKDLLEQITFRGFMDPIMQAHEFITLN